MLELHGKRVLGNVNFGRCDLVMTSMSNTDAIHQISKITCSHPIMMSKIRNAHVSVPFLYSICVIT